MVPLWLSNSDNVHGIHKSSKAKLTGNKTTMLNTQYRHIWTQTTPTLIVEQHRVYGIYELLLCYYLSYMCVKVQVVATEVSTNSVTPTQQISAAHQDMLQSIDSSELGRCRTYIIIIQIYKIYLLFLRHKGFGKHST